MASTTTVHSYTFTPSDAGQLIVTITFEAQGTGSDWGSNTTSTPFCTQSGTTINGDALQMSTTRLQQVIRHVFTVVGGAAVTVGLRGDISGAATAKWWNTKITVELIKK